MTLATTKSLLSLIRKHVSRKSSEAGCRLLIDVVMLRLASVLSDENENLHIIPKYTITKIALNSEQSFDIFLNDPLGALNREDLVQIGSSNIFEAKTLPTLMAGVAQVVIAAATMCRQTKKECTRGAITCGDHWIFFAYKAPIEDGNNTRKAKLARTPILRIGHNEENLDLILGILIDWIENANMFDTQKYFEVL